MDIFNLYTSSIFYYLTALGVLCLGGRLSFMCATNDTYLSYYFSKL